MKQHDAELVFQQKVLPLVLIHKILPIEDGMIINTTMRE